MLPPAEPLSSSSVVASLGVIVTVGSEALFARREFLGGCDDIEADPEDFHLNTNKAPMTS